MPYFTVWTHCEEELAGGRAAGSEEQALLGLSTIKQQAVEAVCWEKVVRLRTQFLGHLFCAQASVFLWECLTITFQLNSPNIIQYNTSDLFWLPSPLPWGNREFFLPLAGWELSYCGLLLLHHLLCFTAFTPFSLCRWPASTGHIAKNLTVESIEWLAPMWKKELNFPDTRKKKSNCETCAWIFKELVI